MENASTYMGIGETDPNAALSVRCLKDNAIVAPVSIGQYYGGGIVFKVSDNGQHGYIAALEDLGPIAWSNAEKLCTDYRGGGYTDWFFPSGNLVEAMFNFDYILSPGSLHLGGANGYVYYADEPYEVLSWDMRGGGSKCCYGFGKDTAPVRPVRAF